MFRNMAFEIPLFNNALMYQGVFSPHTQSMVVLKVPPLNVMVVTEPYFG